MYSCWRTDFMVVNLFQGKCCLIWRLKLLPVVFDSLCLVCCDNGTSPKKYKGRNLGNEPYIQYCTQQWDKFFGQSLRITPVSITPSKLHNILQHNNILGRRKGLSLEIFKQTNALSDRKYFHIGFCLLRRTMLENKE